MAKIQIEINCGVKYCDDCNKQYGDIIENNFRYCNLFQCFLGNRNNGPISRCEKCLYCEKYLEAEFK